MKTTKKNMILVAISVGIIVCVGIIMAVVAQNKTSAATSACPTHGKSFLKYTSLGGGKHKVECSACSSNLGTENCFYTSGKCTYCKATCTHSNVTATKVNSSYHKVTCNTCRYVVDEMESHSWNSSNKCTACGATKSGGGTGCIDGGPHNVTSGLPNYDGTHTGTCTKCGQEATVNCNLYSDFINKTATTHTEVIKCSGCYYEDRKTAEPHTGGTHSNGGKCTVCDYQYQNHGQGTTIVGYDKTATTHKPKYACTEPECTEIYTGTEELHNLTSALPNFDGTHTGTCTVCGEEITEKCRFRSEYIDITVTKHTEVVRCSVCNLEEIKIPEAHHYIDGICACGARPTDECTNHQITTGTDNGDGTHTGTCPNCEKQITEEHNFENGTCTKCRAAQNEQTCTNHQITTGTDNGDGTHTGTCSNCNKQITEEHNFENGTCTKCGASETCEHEFEMKHNDTMHWEQCKKCNEVKNNKKHSFVNGKCSVCEYECQHTNTTAKKDNTYHWTECNDCGKELNKEKHSYTNGKCSCGKTEETAECTHANKEWKYNTNQHWKECKDCGATIEGTKAAHNFVNGKCSVCTYECKHTNTTVKKDNTYHWTECNDCGKELNKEQHSYINGKCNCGEVEKTEECTHTNREWKSNTTEHWQVCKDCGQEIEGTRAKHVNVDGKCKNCGLQEDSKSGTKIPNTGNKTMIITLPLVLAFAAFGAIKMKKYKEI